MMLLVNLLVFQRNFVLKNQNFHSKRRPPSTGSFMVFNFWKRNYKTLWEAFTSYEIGFKKCILLVSAYCIFSRNSLPKWETLFTFGCGQSERFPVASTLLKNTNMHQRISAFVFIHIFGLSFKHFIIRSCGKLFFGNVQIIILGKFWQSIWNLWMATGFLENENPSYHAQLLLCPFPCHLYRLCRHQASPFRGDSVLVELNTDVVLIATAASADAAELLTVAKHLRIFSYHHFGLSGIAAADSAIW